MKVFTRKSVGCLIALLLLCGFAVAEDNTSVVNTTISPIPPMDMTDEELLAEDNTSVVNTTISPIPLMDMTDEELLANAEILAAHTRYRNPVGSPPLTWSTAIASSAQTYANTLATSCPSLAPHSGGAYGENIAQGTVGGYSWTDMVNGWGSEKQDFIYAPFGNGASKTGDWHDIGHYTQVVWSDSTQCGCGKASRVGCYWEYFVCQYNPRGNYGEQYPYLARERIGLWRPSTQTWYLDYDNDGKSDYQVKWGESTDKPVVGDWDNDGVDEIGLWRPSTQMWYLDFNNNGASDYRVKWGSTEDIPIAGDWDNDGYDEIGLWRPSTQTWYLDYDNNGKSDYQVKWGGSTDKPITGDWDGDGDDNIGLWRPSNTKWYLDYDNNGLSNFQITWGSNGDIPLAGDYYGTQIRDEIGLFRKSTSNWYLDYDSPPNGASNYQVTWGVITDIPFTGKWV